MTIGFVETEKGKIMNDSSEIVIITQLGIIIGLLITIVRSI